MHMKTLSGIVCVVLLGACAQVPRPSTYPYSFQQKMQAAHHWQVLAETVAECIDITLNGASAASLNGGSPPSTDMARRCRDKQGVFAVSRQPVFIQTQNSPFGQAFPNLLIAELENRGIDASAEDQNNLLSLTWYVQPVVHQAYRRRPLPSVAEAIIAIPPSLFVDAWSGMAGGPLPHTEMILTTWLTARYRNTPKRTQNYLYYINDEDSYHYSESLPLAHKTYAVVDR
jgi:hypothetical protein